MKKAAWTLQILLALAFAAAGSTKLITPHDQLTAANGMGWAQEFSSTQVKLIGAAEVLGAIGLIAPAATGRLPALTPAAGAGLAVLMAGAAMTHLRRGEPFIAPLVLGILAVIVVWLRSRFSATPRRVTA